MSTSNVHQQSFADAGSETRPSMLGRVFTPSETEAPRMQKEDDLRGDNLKHYEAEIKAMNLILISIPNEIYNSVDACTTAKAMWQRVELLNLEAKVKKNVDTVLKIGNSLQGMFMLGPKPMSFYDSRLKHGLGYANSYTLKKAISQNPKLYDASCLDDSKIHMNVRDTEDILEDATKSQIKMKNKMKDPVAIQKKQNMCTIDYNKLISLYDDFVPQKELSDEQKYFPPSFISSEDPSNESSSYSSSETKPTQKLMPSANPILVDLNQMENDFQKLFYDYSCLTDSAVTYTSVHSEARSWSIPSEDPYEEAARQLLEQAPHSPEYVPADHVPVYIPEPEHPEDLVPAEDEAPTPLLPPSFLAPRIRPLSPRALEVEMRDIASAFYHSLHPSGTPPSLPIPAPPTSRRADIPEADTPPRKRLLLTTPRPGCEIGESSAAAAARQPGPTIETRLLDTERRIMTALELVNRRVSYQVDVCTRESSEFCTRHHDAQTDRAAVRAEIEVLRRERLAYEQESIQTRQDLARSEAHCRALEAPEALEARARVDTLEDTGSSS
ncbi:hypothetical protein Tco_0016945 [Tanacetum coccineum]